MIPLPSCLRRALATFPAPVFALCLASAGAGAQPAGVPVITLKNDNTVIQQSCIIRIAPGKVIADADGNGVIHVEGEHITIEFEEGSVLRGAPETVPWNELTGVGIRLDDRAGVTIQNARVRGFKAGILATGADGLAVIECDLSDNFRQRLGSTPAAEDPSDWLWPHQNDANEWLTNYGAALYIEESSRVVVRDVVVRRGQNGIILDRVSDSKVYDNDCSFLSGWGLAMWRSSRNLVSRNAFDFCVRGHSEGVYNRGQDSAGILVFEQCRENIFAENSATHGGDGFFCFAGKEAIGEAPAPAGFDYADAGCNDNTLVGNDFSDAPAHGIEITFSKGNRLFRNRIVNNGICGFWGGYSRGTAVVENIFDGNGALAYGLERGAINMEHASDNIILRNTFVNNRCGVHLWWDDDGKLLSFPGVQFGYRGVKGNFIIDNVFEVNARHGFPGTATIPVLQLRDAGQGNVAENTYAGNRVKLEDPRAVEIEAPAVLMPGTTHPNIHIDVSEYEAVGFREPFGARPHLRGRANIIMDEWGPWDHASPMVRRAHSARGHAYEVFGVNGDLYVTVVEGPVTTTLDAGPLVLSYRVGIAAPDGVTPYAVKLTGAGLDREVRGVAISATWQVRAFPWTIDPREDLDGWRAQAASGGEFSTRSLSFAFGGGGPARIADAAGIKQAVPGSDRFGIIARTSMPLPKGRWKFTTLSDDGIRVRVNDATVIENWTWHGPAEDSGVYEQPADGLASIEVEYFELDGHAVLQFDIAPANPR